MPRIAVLQLSESFASVFDELANRVPSSTYDADAYLIAAGGIEEEAPSHIAMALAQGAREIVVVGATSDHRVAVQLIRAGAADYFALPEDIDRLRAWLAEVARRANADADARSLAARERASYDFSRMIGESPELKAALQRAARIISHADATVLITGETGTGKELLAQAIHYNGPRANKPIVEINCTALPATLLEAELFGYEKGAFTGATSPKPGLFEAAHGGTLFLDEIGDLTLELQAKLLRALETRQARRLGSVRTIDFDVRLVAATHVDLSDAVGAGSFREDLYYRLNVVPIHLPALRSRGNDVVLLAHHFIEHYAAQYGIKAPPLDEQVRASLLSYEWPGNVRELKNSIERALLLGDGALSPYDLLPSGGRQTRGTTEIRFPARMDDIEREAALAMVRHCDGNKTAAADALGISRSRLYRLIGDDG